MEVTSDSMLPDHSRLSLCRLHLTDEKKKFRSDRDAYVIYDTELDTRDPGRASRGYVIPDTVNGAYRDSPS